MRWLFLFGVIAGCASAERDGVSGRPDGGHPDAPTKVYLDAPPPMVDAPAGQQSRTLSQTNSQTIAVGASIACRNGTGATLSNNYYRVFDLPAAGITTTFHVSEVSFQVDYNDSARVAVRVGTYNGVPGETLAPASITILMSNATVAVPSISAGGTVDVPMTATIPAGSKLLVEIDSPDGSSNGTAFFIGTNAGGETGFSYMSSSACSSPGTTPTHYTTVAGSEEDLLLTVTGSY